MVNACIKFEELSRTETLSSIKSGISDVFQSAFDDYFIEDGKVAEIPGRANKYKIGVVFDAISKETGDVDHIVYHPIRGAYVLYTVLAYTEVNLIGQEFQAKRGKFKVEMVENEQAFVYDKVIQHFVCAE